jgi:hypothetical protein
MPPLLFLFDGKMIFLFDSCRVVMRNQRSEGILERYFVLVAREQRRRTAQIATTGWLEVRRFDSRVFARAMETFDGRVGSNDMTPQSFLHIVEDERLNSGDLSIGWKRWVSTVKQRVQRKRERSS